MDDVIKCPMKPPEGVSSEKMLQFNVTIGGNTHDFGKFTYYKQIEIDGANPQIGPNEGKSHLYINGRFFKSFPGAKPLCRIGNTKAKANIIDRETIQCVLNDKIPLTDEGQYLPVTASLNSYSWAKTDQTFRPYGVETMNPSSGPVGDNTAINVFGKGFENDLTPNARCRFGTMDNYQLVKATVLDDSHLICKQPAHSLKLPPGANSAISIPFGIAFEDDIYFPFTEGPQRYRLYKHPETVEVEPTEGQVVQLQEVYVFATEDRPFTQRK
jgi:hypothetical protein